MSTIELYDIPEDLSEALDREAASRGLSVEATVLHMLCESLGVGAVQSNGLEKLAGRWSEGEAREFGEATAFLEEVDEELWR